MINKMKVNPKPNKVEINIREKQLKDAMQRKKELENRLKFADDEVNKFKDTPSKSLTMDTKG